MGTQVSVLSSAERSDAPTLVQGLFEEWEGRLSRFRPDSELCRLNEAAGRPAVVSGLLADVLAAALAAAADTGGLYDPCLLTQLRAAGYDRSFELLEPELPAAAVAARPGGAWRAIRFDRESRIVELPAGAALDFGGIAKGLAVDAAVDLLEAAGHAAAAVEAGGDVRVLGSPPGGGAWTGEVELREGAQSVDLHAGALATSGIGLRSWRQGGRRRHHLLDPRTGLPAESGLWSVSVAAARCAQAEVAAKTAFVLGAEAGAELLERLGLAGLLIREDGGLVRAGGWPD